MWGRVWGSVYAASEYWIDFKTLFAKFDSSPATTAFSQRIPEKPEGPNPISLLKIGGHIDSGRLF